MLDCIIDKRTSIIFRGDTQSYKDNLAKYINFDASVDNVDIITYEMFSPVWFPLLRSESSRAIVISPSILTIAFGAWTKCFNLMKLNHCVLP